MQSADASLRVVAHRTGSAVLELIQSEVSTKAAAHCERHLLINTTAGRNRHTYTKHTGRGQAAEP